MMEKLRALLCDFVLSFWEKRALDILLLLLASVSGFGAVAAVPRTKQRAAWLFQLAE